LEFFPGVHYDWAEPGDRLAEPPLSSFLAGVTRAKQITLDSSAQPDKNDPSSRTAIMCVRAMLFDTCGLLIMPFLYNCLNSARTITLQSIAGLNIVFSE